MSRAMLESKSERDTMLNIRDKARILHEKGGVTQAYIAKRLGISRQAYGAWLRGHTIQLKDHKRLARILKRPLYTMAEEEE